MTDDDTDEPIESTEDTSAEEPPRRPTRWLVTMLVLVALLAASLVTGALHLGSVLDYRATAERRDAIMSVAREVAELSYSLDYESFPRQVSKIVSATTGDYRKGLIDSTKGLQHLLTEGKVRSTCTITAAGIERDDENTATVLFSITTRVTNTEIQQPQVRHYRVAIGLTRQGDQWLVQSNDVIA
jgi:Mce-associated membrane protein